MCHHEYRYLDIALDFLDDNRDETTALQYGGMPGGA